ncbi:hypothetical protein ABH14_28655 [Brevibacillus brevis]|uniref:hypothetical protein n=1 Tax=Brevibacillus brevis TaxID=1393 RepID=UPI00190194D6|nr:hypothetical protein [Brevibacillus brevis]MBH0333654.1 hypothetical protein [Brevibacillus brevis]
MQPKESQYALTLTIPVEREMWELTKKMNFSGWAKGHLKPLALARIAERNASTKKIGIPIPVRRVVGSDVSKA